MRRLAALLLAFTATCAFTPPSPGLPRFPSSAPSRYGPVPVTLVESLTCNGEPAWGCFHYQTRTIEIEKTLDPQMEFKVLFHELFHLAAFDGHLHFASPEAENFVADAVAEQRLTELLSRFPR